jgi:hypothetical protein
MSMTPTIALANLIIQVVLIVGALTGAYLARRRLFSRHCLSMRILVGVQILAIGLIMAPSLSRYVNNWSGFSRFTAEIIVHHVLGVVVLALWIYINLALTGVVKAPRRPRVFMRATLAVWLVSLALGVHLYVHIWR